MQKIVIAGVPDYDGEYELDIDESPFTNRELHRIKWLTGLRAGELADALESRDSDVVLGLAVIALERAGKKIDDEVLWDAPAGTLRFVGDDTEAEVGQSPPAETPGLSDEQPTNGGDSSAADSEGYLGNGQNSTGLPDSAKSAISVPVT